ncbi:MAG: hypothetical protein SPK70_10190 [Succinivibrio dextrinosolvens]|nr:hypothetical protein [Succinivibrio dextrinosolvens]MDY6420969.1 hypothetical protein [Succinivibrio dextrinosolvens]MDY6465015.1 hypothetical protein [Succinivibrio dextrinosolvens]MDY6471424.1 hypothetical protein [Succinivibrio dextrinosolvens]
MKSNQIMLSSEQLEILRKAAVSFEKIYTPGMKALASTIVNFNQILYSNESIRVMQEVAIAIQKLQNQMRGFTDVINKNQAFFSELSKVTQSIHKFTDQFTEVKSQDDLINLLCNTAENLNEVNTQELNKELQSDEKEKLSIDVSFILSFLGLLLSLYSVYLSQTSVSKQDLQPMIETQNQTLTEIKKLLESNLDLVEQNKQLQVKVDKLEQNQKKCSQNNHVFDSDKQSARLPQHSRQKHQSKLKE